MKTKTGIWFVVLLLLAPAVGAQDDVEDISTDANEEYRQHALASLPPLILNAVRGAAPDVYFDSAESYLEKDFRVYRVSGRLFREVWHVFVREDGLVLRTASDIQDD